MEELKSCLHCDKIPMINSAQVAPDEVYWGYECRCKTTPLKRTQTEVSEIWNTITYKQDPKEALQYAKESTPRIVVDQIKEF